MKKDFEQYATFRYIFLHIYHIHKESIRCLGSEEHISLQVQVSRSFQVQSVPFLMKNKSWRESLQFSSSDYCMTGTSTGSNKDSKYCNKVHWCNSSWIFWIEDNFAILSEQRDAWLFPTCFLCTTVSSQGGRPQKAAAELIQQKFSSCSKSLKESFAVRVKWSVWLQHCRLKCYFTVLIKVLKLGSHHCRSKCYNSALQIKVLLQLSTADQSATSQCGLPGCFEAFQYQVLNSVEPWTLSAKHNRNTGAYSFPGKIKSKQMP